MRFRFSTYGLMIAALSTVLFNGCSSGFDTTVECYSTMQFRKQSLPSFTTYLMNVKAGNESRIDVYLQVPYKNVRFEKSVEGYKGSYSIRFVFRNSEKEIIQTRELDRTIIARSYEESVSSRFDASLQSFVLPPSEYLLEISSIDHLSQLRYKESTPLIVRAYPDSSVTASTMLLLDTVSIDEKGLSLRPVFPDLLTRLNDSFGIFQELYNVREGDTVRIKESYSVSLLRKNEDNSFLYFTPPYRVRGNSCTAGSDSMYFHTDSIFTVTKNGLQQLIQFYPLPMNGYNTIVREIIVQRQSSTDTIRFTNKYFLRDWNRSITFDEITSAMRYISREAEYDSLVVGVGDGEDRNKRINQFWSVHGGLERRREFEQRIREANILFSNCTNGAETPMGIVYIIGGVPDYIECRGGYAETWYYNIGERAFPLQFRREDEGITYFSLLPFSINDAVWQYFVDRWRRK